MSTTRAGYRTFIPITTRWNDNDQYGHINNVVFYSYFDTAANTLLIRGGLDPQASPTIALVVESQCHYTKPLTYPDALEAGVAVQRLSDRSVIWRIAIFKQGDTDAAAYGTFVHVFVDRATRRPIAIPDGIRAVLQPLVV